MAEISERKFKEVIGHDEKRLRKIVSVGKDKNQFKVRIPIKFANLAGMKIDKKNKEKFEFILVRLTDGGYSLEGKLVRH